jgi:hypothetical protein
MIRPMESGASGNHVFERSLARDVDQDRLRIAQPDLAVLHHRQLAERVQLQELVGLVLLVDEVDRNALARHLQNIQQQAHLVAAARQLEVI